MGKNWNICKGCGEDIRSCICPGPAKKTMMRIPRELLEDLRRIKQRKSETYADVVERLLRKETNIKEKVKRRLK